MSTPDLTGPHLGSVITGVVCTALSSLALWAQTHDGDLPGRDHLLLAVGAVGALMLVVAVIGLVTQRRRAGL